MHRPIAINVNLSTSGSRLGGAAIAAEFHSQAMAKQFNVELWRMWDSDQDITTGALRIKNYRSQTDYPWLEGFMPRRVRSTLLDSHIRRDLLALQPDIVHLHNPVPSFAFEKLARQASRAGSKVVATTHGFCEVMHPNFNLKPYEKLLWRHSVTKPVLRALRYIDAILTLYPGESEMLLNQGVPAEKIHLIANGVNPYFLDTPTADDCNAVIRKFNLPKNQPILLFIGNHTANKGIEVVMQVASRLSYPATIVIGGKLLSPNEPQQWFAKFPPSEFVKVIFTDYLSNLEQKTLYHLSSLLLFPSMADTLPLTIIEAMACGLPVVAYDTGGIAYQLMEGAGVVVPQGQAVRFRQTVQDLLLDEPQRQRISINAKQRQQQLFCWDLVAQRTIEIYHQLLR